MWAAENGHVEVVKQLLEAGADTDLKDDVRPSGLRAQGQRARRGAWGVAGLRSGGGGGCFQGGGRGCGSC